MSQRAGQHCILPLTEHVRHGYRAVLIVLLLIAGSTYGGECYCLALTRSPQKEHSGFGDKAFAEGERLQAQWKAESLRKAIKKYSEAQSSWRKANNFQRQIQALEKIGDAYFTLSRFNRAIVSYNEALKLARMLKRDDFESELLNRIGSAYLEMADAGKAAEYSNQSYDLSHKAGNRRDEAQALNNLGMVHYLSGAMMKALNSFDTALVAWKEVKEPRGEAETLLNIGYAQGNMGDTEQALSFYNKALSICQTVHNPQGQARALTALGGINFRMGETQKALNYHNQALKLFRAMGNRNGQAATLNGISYIYESMGEVHRARDSYLSALRLYEAVGNQNYAAITMGYVGRALFSLGDKSKALQYYNHKLVISRAVMDGRMEAYTLRDIGAVYDSLGEKPRALDYYSQALVRSRNALDRRGEAYILNNIGSVYDSWGDKQKALDYYNQALKIIREVTDRKGEVSILYNIARSERDMDRLNDARARIEESLNIIELLRTKVISKHLRASYLASVYQHYEFYIDLLMRLHEKQPSNQHDALAFEVSEHARAKTLLEILAEARADIRQGVDPQLLEQERELQQKLNEKAERQMRLLSGGGLVEEADATRKAVEDLLDQFQDIQSQVREKSPRYAALTQPVKLTLPELQKVLDKDTLVLEYSLGSEHSYCWAVTQDSLRSFTLPKRSDIENAARDLYSLISVRLPDEMAVTGDQRAQRLSQAKAQYLEKALKLSRIVLGQVVPFLGTRRLIVVADGALQYVPFSALPEPGKSETDGSHWQPLIVDHEIISLPSLSTLLVMREQLQGRQFAKRALAVLADPVYERSDPRFAAPQTSKQHKRTSEANSIHTSTLRSPAGNERLRFQRLPFSSREAFAITEAAPKESSLQALGFDANRALVMSQELGQYRIVHFATHGLLNSAHPELSAVVLSLLDRHGHPQDGFLRLNEVYNLNLPVELVVLSACQTALGESIRGEGLVSLTRGFMYAGAARVMASLWSVDDRAATELMKRFYGHLLGPKQLSAAEALRAAQIEMWKNERWEFPYYWAAFVLQGEWR